MIKLLIFIFLSFLLFPSDTILSINDPKLDDKGGGNIKYPKNNYVYKPGSFDLLNITIKEKEHSYDFIISINTRFKNRRDYPYKWDIQMFDVYLNLGEGLHTHTITGRNVKILEGWDKAILMSPFGNLVTRKEILIKNRKVWDDFHEYEDLSRDIINPYDFIVDSNTLTCNVSKKYLNLNSLKGIQVFVLGTEGFTSSDETMNKLVFKNKSTNDFSGGIDQFYDPNVIDILGTNYDLNSYYKEGNKKSFATVSLIPVK